MAESISRVLRDGVLEGEHAPALTIKDSVCSPFGNYVFINILEHVISDILASKSQSQSPLFYVNLLKKIGADLASSQRVHILDCYTDPLGWKDRLKVGNIINLDQKVSRTVSLCKNVKELDKLFSLVIELGNGLISEGNGRFSVAIDSVSELLRHTSMSLVAGFLSNIRSHDKIHCVFWRVQSDLLDIREAASFEYISSIVADLQPLNSKTMALHEHAPNSKGRMAVRFKRRNGRVRVMCEGFHVEQSAIKFAPISPNQKIINQELLPKVQFNLHLSEEEQMQRAKVVLPFEHQGIGKPVEIYDGRRSLGDDRESNQKIGTNGDSLMGKIIYMRDSDDEMLDSDEDPDNDLDI